MTASVDNYMTIMYEKAKHTTCTACNKFFYDTSSLQRYGEGIHACSQAHVICMQSFTNVQYKKYVHTNLWDIYMHLSIM